MFASRTRPLLGKIKPGVHEAMKCWWKDIRPVEGEITQHICANEQQIIVPWFKTFPKKVVDRIPIYMWPVSSLFITWVCMEYTDRGSRAMELELRN